MVHQPGNTALMQPVFRIRNCYYADPDPGPGPFFSQLGPGPRMRIRGVGTGIL